MKYYQNDKATFKPFGWCEVSKDHLLTRRGRMQDSCSEKYCFEMEINQVQHMESTWNQARGIN